MSEAREHRARPRSPSASAGSTWWSIGANDPEAMLRHTEECRARGYPFVADPSPAAGLRRRRRRSASWSTARPTCSPTSTRRALTEQKTGWSADEILDRVGIRVTTLGPGRRRGSSARGEPPIEVPVAARGAQGRPDRRRRRLPGRLPRRPGLGPRPPSAAPRSAPCSRPTSSRRSAPRSTSWAEARFLRPVRRRVRRRGGGRDRAATPAPCRARPATASGRDRAGRAAAVAVGARRSSGAEPGEDLVGVGADLRAGHAARGLPRGPVPDGLGAAARGPIGWWSPGPARRPAARTGCACPGRCAGRCRALRGPGRHRVRGGGRRRAPTRRGTGGWITPAIPRAYAELHRLGWAHSVEAWRDGELVGGLYGVAIGGPVRGGVDVPPRAATPRRSRCVALVDLLRADGDAAGGCSTCSGAPPHLATLGVVEVPRRATTCAGSSRRWRGPFAEPGGSGRSPRAAGA